MIATHTTAVVIVALRLCEFLCIFLNYICIALHFKV